MKPTRLLSVTSLALGCALAAASCKPDPKGEILLAIDSDHAPGVDFDRFEIQVTSTSSKDGYDNLVKELGSPGLLTFPVTLALVSNGDPTTSLHIRIATGSSKGAGTAVGVPRNLREIVTTVPTNRAALLHVTLDWLCIGTAKPEPDGYVEGACPEGLTCIAGQCVDWSVDPAALPDYRDEDVFGGGSRSGDGACLDTSACFAEGTMADVDTSDCSVALPTGGLGANVALVVAPGQGGICAGGACLVPLAQGTVEGWRVEGDRAVLPRAACDRMSDPSARTVLGIATTTACATKIASLPTCGPWSPFRKPLGPGGAPAGYVPPRDAGADAR